VDREPSVMSERQHLLNIGYRMLGSLVEAEDVVQEAYARWYAMSPPERDDIRNPGAWLTTVTSRLCLTLLTSARVRRETYVGAWIPEPLPEPSEFEGSPSHADPADRVTLDESVSMALMVVMEAMTPAERVAFVLHDVFGYRFAEIAEIAGRTPGACRQLASSARARVQATRATAMPHARQQEVVRRFKRAWLAKDIDALIGLLDPSVVATADGGGRAVTFLDPIRGRDDVARAWVELADRVGGITLLERTVNGQPGVIARQEDGVTVTVYSFEIVDDRIRHIWAVRNPEKLGPWLGLRLDADLLSRAAESPADESSVRR
jgi:RNA polymerase sigma factor (sigma-70 family)